METIERKIKLLTKSLVYNWPQLAFVSSGTRIKFAFFTCILFSGFKRSRPKRKGKKTEKKSGKNAKEYLLYN